jgi:hypothetical protein
MASMFVILLFASLAIVRLNCSFSEHTQELLSALDLGFILSTGIDTPPPFCTFYRCVCTLNFLVVASVRFLLFTFFCLYNIYLT